MQPHITGMRLRQLKRSVGITSAAQRRHLTLAGTPATAHRLPPPRLNMLVISLKRTHVVDERCVAAASREERTEGASDESTRTAEGRHTPRAPPASSGSQHECKATLSTLRPRSLAVSALVALGNTRTR